MYEKGMMHINAFPEIRSATVADATRLAIFGARLFKETFGEFKPLKIWMTI
jgi:hypothetical protein